MKKIIIALIIVIVVVLFVSQASDKEVVTTQESLCGMSVVSPQDGAVFGEITQIEVVVDNTQRETLGCGWTTFEAQAGTFEFFDGEGNRVAFGILSAEEGVDWMTAEPVIYRGQVVLEEGATPLSGEGRLVITEDDPSGEKVVSKKEITIQF